MKPENQINAGLILLLHSVLIAIGMVVAYTIPSADARPASIGLSFYNLRTQHQSDEELQSWLSFAELPHEEMLVSKETLAAVLKKDKTLAYLDFFHNVAAGDRTDYLAERISATENEDLPYKWNLSVKGASQEETNTLLSALKLTHERRLQKIGSASEPPIKVNDLAIDEASELQIGKACSPAVGAFLAVILVVIAWSTCASKQRKLPFSSSISQLLIASSLLALVGAGIGFLVGANTNKEFESELVVQVRALRFTFAGNWAPETRQLMEDLDQKIQVKNYLGHLKSKSIISELVKRKGMATWRSFAPVARNQFSQKENEGDGENDGDGDGDGEFEANHDLLCDHILDRLEIEQDEQAPEIYTLRFRCADKVDSASLLMCLVNSFNERMDEQAETTEFGSQLANKYQVERLSLPDPEKVSWTGIAASSAFEGALLGAIFSLVTLSSTRVLAGSPPI